MWTFPVAVTVPSDEYFVLGDSHGVSDDSRFWGSVSAAWIVGTVVRCRILDVFCTPMH